MRPVVLALLLLFFSVGTASTAHAQFTLTPTQLHPASVDPGGSASATIDLTATGGFNNAVDFTCAVTSNQTVTSPPVCLVSPDTETPPATPSVTITTTGATPAGTYQITVTGTSGPTVETATLNLNVANLTQDYTLSVLPTTAIPSPIPAGNSATTVVTVSPLGSYTGMVTLSCLSVSPVVAGAPVCSFKPATVSVTSGVPPTSTMTITTFGTLTTKLYRPHMFYALWLAIPALAFVGLGGASKRGTRLMGMFLLVAIANGLLLLPACSSSTTNKAAANQITPVNTYTFTLTGADANGAAPSSTTTATVTLQVTAVQ